LLLRLYFYNRLGRLWCADLNRNPFTILEDPLNMTGRLFFLLRRLARSNLNGNPFAVLENPLDIRILIQQLTRSLRTGRSDDDLDSFSIFTPPALGSGDRRLLRETPDDCSDNVLSMSSTLGGFSSGS
jgi:hypothetical protein